MTLKDELDRRLSKGEVYWITAIQIKEMFSLTARSSEIDTALEELGHAHRESAHHKLWALRLARDTDSVKRTRKSR